MEDRGHSLWIETEDGCLSFQPLRATSLEGSIRLGVLSLWVDQNIKNWALGSLLEVSRTLEYGGGLEETSGSSSPFYKLGKWAASLEENPVII